MSFSTAGTHLLTATYVPSGFFSGSTSNTVSEVITTVQTGLTATPAVIRVNQMTLAYYIPVLSATLTDSLGAPLPGRTIVFTEDTIRGPILLGSAVTDANGTATLYNVPVPVYAITNNAYTASFAGGGGTLPSSASAPLIFQPL